MGLVTISDLYETLIETDRRISRQERLFYRDPLKKKKKTMTTTTKEKKKKKKEEEEK